MIYIRILFNYIINFFSLYVNVYQWLKKISRIKYNIIKYNEHSVYVNKGV